MLTSDSRVVHNTANAHGFTYLPPLRTWLIAIALVGLLVAAVAPATFADTVFSVSGNFGNGASFDPGSSVTIDTTLGILTDSNLSISPGSNPSPANIFSQADVLQNGSFMTPFVWKLADGTELDFFMPAPDFQGFTGGTISLVTYFQVPGWGFSNGSTDTLLTPVATPEPAAFTLLATGLLTLIGLAFWQKRFDAASCESTLR
jgi:hypothetical protein